MDTRDLRILDPELKAELHDEWLRSAFTQELLENLQKEIKEIHETLLGLAQTNCQDTVRITNTMNRWLILDKVVTYVRHRNTTSPK